MDYYIEIYKNMLKNIERANETVEKVIHNLQEKWISNCKLMGKQLLMFDVKKLAGKLGESIE